MFQISAKLNNFPTLHYITFVSNVWLKFFTKMNGFKFDFSWGGAHRVPSPDPSPILSRVSLQVWASHLRLGLSPRFSGTSRPRLGLCNRFTSASRPRFVDSPSTKLALNFLMKNLVCPPGPPKKFLDLFSICPPPHIHFPSQLRGN